MNDLIDAWQWLKDCGGTMAYANNPLADQLVQAGLAKKGGYDNLGRRTLVMIPGQNPPGYSPPLNRRSIADIIDFFETLPNVPRNSDLPREMATRALNLSKRVPSSMSSGSYKGTWSNIISWIPEMVGFDGSKFNVIHRGGLVIMSPRSWVHLSGNYSAARFMTQDAYILGGLIGLIDDTAVLVSSTIPDDQAIVMNRTFSYHSPFQNVVP